MSTTLDSLKAPVSDYSYAFLDEFAKRELRRKILKAIAIPGYQVPYASREMPIARGWGTGGLQATLAIIGPRDVIKVIDQGADDSVNAANLRRFIARMAGVTTTTDALKATIIQSRHRIPEERLRRGQTLVLQVPIPEPLRYVEPDVPKASQRHADADYSPLWLQLFERLINYRRDSQGADAPVIVHGRYVMAPSPIPRWDNPKLHQAAHLTILSAGREKRIYAVPPYTDVRPLEFEDIPFLVEDQSGRICRKTGVTTWFMNEIPEKDGSASFELSDTGFIEKLVRKERGESSGIGPTYYDPDGRFYVPGYLKDHGSDPI